MAKGVELASAYISLSVSTDRIPQEIEKALGASSTGRSAGKSAEKIGKDLGQRLSASFGSSTSKALADELGKAGDKGSRELLKELSSGLGRAERDVKVAGQRYAKALADSMRGGSREAAQKMEGEFRQALATRDMTRVFFDQFNRNAAGRGEAAGRLIGRTIGTGIKVGLTAAVAGATAAVGGLAAVLTKGFQRYKSLDQTAKRLRAMGLASEEVKSVMADINEVVDGTPVALDAAADAASKFITAGMKGQELKDTLTAIANAAGASGADFSTLATIFSQVNNKGRLMGEELQQLAEHGLNAFPLLEKHIGELPDKVADAGLTVKDLVSVINAEFGGMAKSAADTVEGAMSQMDTAVKRLGANMIAAVFGDPTDAEAGPGKIAEMLNKITERIDNLNKTVATNGPEIQAGIAAIGSAAITMAEITIGAFEWTIRGVGWFVNAIGDISGGLTRAQAAVLRFFRQTEEADELDAMADSMFSWGDGILSTADALGDARRQLGGFNENVRDFQRRAEEAAKFTNQLGNAIAKVEQKDVILKAPTKEDLDRIDKAKWAIIDIPDSKDVIIRPRTSEAVEEINEFRRQQGETPVTFFADANVEPAENEAEAFRKTQENQSVVLPVNADITPAQKMVDRLAEFFRKYELPPLETRVIVNPALPQDIPPTVNGMPVIAPNDLGGLLGADQGALNMGPSAAGPGNAPQQLPKQGHSGSSYVVQQSLIGDAAAGQTAATSGVNWAVVDQVAKSLGLTLTSGTRPGDRGYHGVGMARDYAGPPAAMQKFAAILAQRFGGQLKELIHDAPGWASNIKNGKVVGPFGAFYTMNQAGRHDDHVHVAFGSGGAVHGPGGPTADRIPAWLSDGEHVLSARDVEAMGGQAGVYAFRNALHRAKGGSIEHELWKMDRDKVPWFVPGNRQPWSDIPRVGIQAGSEYRTSGPIWDQGPIWEWWMFPGPGQKLAPGSRERQNRRGINWGPYNPRWDPGLDPGLPGLGPGKHGPGGSFEQELRRRLGFAEGGAVVLEELLALAGQQNPNPATTQHGQGALPGPTQEQLQQIAEGSPDALEQLQQGMIPQQQDPLRTEGYIPAGASFTGKTGGGLLGGVINLGASAIKGVIDQAAQAASSAVGAAVAGASMGTAAPAAPAGAAAAQAAIGLGAEAAKRAVDYGAEMANIGIGAVTEILSPFGAPRWMSDLDPTAFIPRWDISDALTTTAEQQRQQPGQQPGEPMSPEPHQGTGAPPGPGATPGDPQATPGSVPPPTVAPSVAPGSPPPVQNNTFDFIKQITGGVYDQGGVLQPGTAAINLSKRPEYVFNASQWKTLENMASQNMMSGGGATYNVYATDVETALRELRKQERRNSRQYSGRP